MRSLLLPVLAVLAACNPPASSPPDDGRIVVLEKQNKAFEERVAHLERDLAEVRAQLAQAPASDAGVAKAAAPPPPTPPRLPARTSGY